MPVSYTHLDVYKRQEQQRTGDTQRSADILGSDLLVIFEFFRRKDNL